MRPIIILFVLAAAITAQGRTESVYISGSDCHPVGDSGYCEIHFQLKNKTWEGACSFAYDSCYALGAGRSYNFTMPDDPHDRYCHGYSDYYKINRPGGECALVDDPQHPHQNVVYYIYPL